MRNIQKALIIYMQGADREMLVAAALKCGLSPICCSNLAEARTLIPQEKFRIVLCSEVLGDGDFRAVLREAHKLNAHTPVVVLGRSYGWDTYLKALREGAYDYIACPPNPLEVESVLWLVLADAVHTEKESREAA